MISIVGGGIAFTITVAILTPRKRMEGETERQSLATGFAGMRAVTVNE